MSSQQQNAVLQAKLDTQWEYRKMCAHKNGTGEMPPRIVIEEEPKTIEAIKEIPTSVKISKTDLQSALATIIDNRESVTREPTAVSLPKEPVADTAEVVPSSLLRNILLATGVAVGGSGLVGLGSWLASDAGQPPVDPIPSEESGKNPGNWMEWLNDEGYNLPPSRMLPGE